MENEVDLLHILNKNNNLTQREISNEVNISLGMVNYLIKKFTKKGLVKIEKINSKNLRYILTPKGMRELSKRSLDYIKNSYRAVQNVKFKLRRIVNDINKRGKKICHIDKNNEISELVISFFEENKIEYSLVNCIDEIEDKKNAALICWNINCEKIMKDYPKMEVLDILK